MEGGTVVTAPEPWIKPRLGYHHRRLDQHRKWFGENRKSLPKQAEIVIAELLAMNDTATECMHRQSEELAQLKAKDNPDAAHERFQREGHRVDMVLRRHRTGWEER
jgi:hypothetical protein